METLSTYQIQIFLYSCILGIILGLIYDCFKILRLITNLNKKYLIFLDIIFMSISAIITFIFLLALNFGQIRLHLILGELLGFITYKLTLSKLIISLSKIIINFITTIANFIKQKLLKPFAALILKIKSFILSFIQKNFIKVSSNYINLKKSKRLSFPKYRHKNQKILK